MAAPVADAVYPSLDLAECPYPFYDHLLREAPVYRVPQTGEWLVTRHDDVQYVMRNWEVFSASLAWERASREGTGLPPDRDAQKSVIATDPPEHKAKRELVFEGFKPGRLRTYEPKVHEIVGGVLDGWVPRGEVEFVSEYATPIPILVFCAIFFGDPETDFDAMRRWATFEGSGITYLPDERKADAKRRAEGLSDFLKQSIMSRYEHPVEDVLSDMIKIQVDRDGALNVPYLMEECGLLLAGGFVTTQHLISNAMLLLLQHPDALAQVRANRALIKPMLEEALRLESPVQWQRRVTRVDTEIGGVEIPAGELVLTVLGAANRDPRCFHDPASFDIGRKNVNDHVAFGYGTHFCPGAPLGRMEARIGFEKLFDRVGEIRFAEGKNDFLHVESPEFRGVRELHLEFDAA
jgi:cytochrome P450